MEPFLQELFMQVVRVLLSVGLGLLRLWLWSVRIFGLQNELMTRSLANLRGFILVLQLMLIQNEHRALLGSNALIVTLGVIVVLFLRSIDFICVRFGSFEIGMAFLFQGHFVLNRRRVHVWVGEVFQILVVSGLGDPVGFLVLNSHFTAFPKF